MMWSVLVVTVTYLLCGCTVRANWLIKFTIINHKTLYLYIVVQALWTDFEMGAVSSLNQSDGKPIVFDLRTKRIRKGVYGIAGEVHVTDDLDGYSVNATKPIAATDNKC